MKSITVRHRIDSDFILDLYERAKKEKGEARIKLLKQVAFFSKHIGEYLAK